MLAGEIGAISRDMRAALAALLCLLPAPVWAEECKFYNHQGQSVAWAGDTIFVDPLYVPPFSCPLTAIPQTDAFTANCGTWSTTVVIGYADNEAGASAIVWDNVFFWLRCDKDRA